MISRITGTLLAVGEARVEIERDGLVYEVLVPAAGLPGLATCVGQPATFFTLHVLEGQGQGTSFVPRLIGFATAADRAFFELFTTVKGVGNRKALRALQLPFGTVAEAIAAKNVDLLVTLPEIGKRTAETIVVELHDKVSRFVELKPAADTSPDPASSLVRDAIAVLTQLGEPRPTAVQLVDRAVRVTEGVTTADELVTAALRLKETG